MFMSAASRECLNALCLDLAGILLNLVMLLELSDYISLTFFHELPYLYIVIKC